MREPEKSLYDKGKCNEPMEAKLTNTVERGNQSIYKWKNALNDKMTWQTCTSFQPMNRKKTEYDLSGVADYQELSTSNS